LSSGAKWSLEYLRRLTEEVGSVSLQGKIPTESLIAHQILRCLMALDLEERDEHIRRLRSMIPNSWIDEEFEKDIEEAHYTYEEPVYHKWCGITVTGSEELPPKMVVREGYDWDAVFEACWNLFDRRGLLLKKRFREVQTGIRFEDARAMAREIMEKTLPEEAEE